MNMTSTANASTNTSTKEINKGWNLEGASIKAMYLGDILVEGEVISSRVKYGASIRHEVELFPYCRKRIENKIGRGTLVLVIKQEDIVEINKQFDLF